MRDREYLWCALSSLVDPDTVPVPQEAGEKQEKLKDLGRKLTPMEDVFREFRAWMSESEAELTSLSLPASEEGERSRQRDRTVVR